MNTAFRPHEALPVASADELTRQAFVIDMKAFLERELQPVARKAFEARVLPEQRAAFEPGGNRNLARKATLQLPEFQHWSCLSRVAQEMMWDSCLDTIDRQLEPLGKHSVALATRGSLTLDANMQTPRYLAALDTHCMPGSYGYTGPGDDVRQGALYDMAGMLFNRFQNGGGLNDGRGKTIDYHLRTRFPEIKPQRMLEMGCTVGQSTIAVARAYPDAELHAIDVGAGLLRYAHARASALGVDVHFTQANAEQTNFEDGSFDVVYSCVMLHETSAAALPRIMRETARLLRPGGAFVHLEVPFPYADLTPWEYIRNENETWCNNEPFWRGSLTADLAGLAKAAGLRDVMAGFQSTNPAIAGQPQAFTTQRGPVYACWSVVSGRK